ncbi:hypothetical protein BDFB_005486 [Asbolus verrucosus]|uniref:Uncharacterized protein n=1 Tax=Asbolus verrucosus TaxID=1661398 RepID=A0A482WDV9_ASBVE|nr:hypothetical protein BDFB_005486 [Asbolus verrucosus]
MNRVDGNPYYLGLVVALSVQFIICVFTLVVWSLSWFKARWNFICSNVSKFLLCVVTNMILSRYRSLKFILKAYFQENKSFVSIRFMKQVENTMYTLKQNVGTYNDMFGWPIFQHNSWRLFCGILSRWVGLLFGS